MVASEKRLAEDMARDLHLAEAAIKPALAGSFGPQKKAASADAKAGTKPTAKNKKKSRAKARLGSDDPDDFVAQVAKAKKPA